MAGQAVVQTVGTTPQVLVAGNSPWFRIRPDRAVRQPMTGVPLQERGSGQPADAGQIAIAALEGPMTPRTNSAITHPATVLTTPRIPWPQRTHLELLALPSAVACARGHARWVALEWGLPDLADNLALLVSELMTNAVRASARAAAGEPPIVRLWLMCDQASVVIYVWDASSQMPVRHDAGPDSEGGRGLLVIDALSTDWGAYSKDKGKVVWVMISRAQVPLNPMIRKAR